MGRPKLDKSKEATVSVRMLPELRTAIEGLAREERRTLSQMAEILLQEAIDRRPKKVSVRVLKPDPTVKAVKPVYVTLDPPPVKVVEPVYSTVEGNP